MSSNLNRPTSERDSCHGLSWEERLAAQSTVLNLVRAGGLWPGEHERFCAWLCKAEGAPETVTGADASAWPTFSFEGTPQIRKEDA